MAAPIAYGSFEARAWIQAAAPTYATAMATQGYLKHCDQTYASTTPKQLQSGS